MSFINNGNFSRIFILTDKTVDALWSNNIVASLKTLNPHVIAIPPGEKSKSLAQAEHVWRALLTDEADRQSLLINLGGGMISDLGGFVATSFMRGIAFVNIPTTLLGMVDTAIGGKTGVNLGGVKNLIGQFAVPEFVWIWPGFLKTLPEREYRSGMAEVIKYGIITGGKLWELLQTPIEKNINHTERFIELCVATKSGIVDSDFKEKGFRKVLNLGHTFGHAFESESIRLNNPLLHGEAIALGLFYEAGLAMDNAGLESKSLEEIKQVILNQGIYLPKLNFSFEALWPWMQHDKKNKGEKIGFSLPEEIGNVAIDCYFNQAELESWFENFNKQQAHFISKIWGTE